MNNNKSTLWGIIAVAIVAMMMASCNNDNSTQQTATNTSTTGEATNSVMPLAYIDLDSLIVNYKYANQVQEELMREMESRQATFNQKQRNFENEARDFQRKVENNAFFDQARAQREQERILKLQQQLQELTQKLQVELLQLEADKMKALTDTIMSHVRQYNEEIGHYQMILTNKSNDNIIYADKKYDITEAVTKYLNDKYKPVNKEE